MNDIDVVRLRFIEQHEAKYGPILPENVAPGSIDYHKASHASLMCLGMVERHLKLDPVVLSDPDLFQRTQEAIHALMQLYVLIGEKNFQGSKTKKKRKANTITRDKKETAFTQFDAADYLHTEEDIAEFLAVARQDENPDVLASAAEAAAKARARMSASKK